MFDHDSGFVNIIQKDLNWIFFLVFNFKFLLISFLFDRTNIVPYHRLKIIYIKINLLKHFLKTKL